MFLNESRCKVAERCLQNFYWRYLYGGYGLEARSASKPLIEGNLAHAGFAALYREENPDPAIDRELRQLINLDNLDAETYNEWLDTAQWWKKVMVRYAKWAQGEDDFAVLGVEQSGACVLGEKCYACGNLYPYGDDKWMLTHGSREPSCPTCFAAVHYFVGRLDLLIRDDNGVAVLDHKTTSSGINDWYLQTFDYSTQMWGYCYLAQKISGHRIGRYYINIIRKVKAAAEEPEMTKSCPGCGRRKNKGCAECVDEPTPGRVPRLPKAADIPFVRQDFSFNEKRVKWFVDSRIRLANKIDQHRARLADGDATAFPHNPSSVGCDPDLCYGRAPGEPFADRFIDEERYTRKGPDYVTEKQLALEEGV